MTSPAKFFARRECDLVRPHSPLHDPEPIIPSVGDVPGEISGLGFFALMSIARIASRPGSHFFRESMLFGKGRYFSLRVLLVIDREKKNEEAGPVQGKLVIDRLLHGVFSHPKSGFTHVLLVIREDQKHVDPQHALPGMQKEHPYTLVGCSKPIAWGEGVDFHRRLMEGVVIDPRTWDPAWLDPLNL